MTAPTQRAASTDVMAVLGAGSWGSALAIQFARSGRPVRLWGRDGAQLAVLERERCNRRYLPDAGFPDSLHAESDLAAAIAGSELVLLAVPSQALRSVLEQLKPHLRPGMGVAWATKGLEQESGKLPHQLAQEVLGRDWPMAALSGPTFAREVGAGLPTAMTVASPDEAFAKNIAKRLSGNNFRAYTSTDIIGVEIGGAVKNVLAIGVGIADGMGFGANTRIALITRGLAEITRLGEALGARRETFMGLAGLGDLVLTCTDNQSRNRRFGLAIASGQSLEQAQKGIQQVVEGLHGARAVHQLATRHQIDMPICEVIYRVLYERLPIKEAVQALMARELRPESD